MNARKMTGLMTAALTTLVLGACTVSSPAPQPSTPPSGGTQNPNPTPNDPAPAPTDPAVTQGFITGTVVNAQGQPLKGAKVVADNTLLYDSNLIVHTDAQGRYRIDVRNMPATFKVSAEMQLKYEGYNPVVSLVPDSDELVAGNVGGVRNFTLKPKPVTHGDPYGNLGMVNVQRGVGFYDVDESKVELTLTPVGELADGTSGKSLVVKPIQTGSGWIVPNVMYGTYTVTATQEGQPLEIRKKASATTNPEWGQSYTGGFEVAYWISTPSIYVEIRRPQN